MSPRPQFLKIQPLDSVIGNYFFDVDPHDPNLCIRNYNTFHFTKFWRFSTFSIHLLLNDFFADQFTNYKNL